MSTEGHPDQNNGSGYEVIEIVSRKTFKLFQRAAENLNGQAIVEVVGRAGSWYAHSYGENPSGRSKVPSGHVNVRVIDRSSTPGQELFRDAVRELRKKQIDTK